MSGRFADPFAAPYFPRALAAAAALRQAPALDRIGGYEIVAELAPTVLLGRRSDGILFVLKGSEVVAAAELARREAEALRLIRHGFGGVLTIEEVLGVPGGPVQHLCLPHCPGGSLRDRLAGKDIGVAELAYHGLALACALHQLHRLGLVHGDVKPENVLFAHGDEGFTGREPRWRTVLSDLETMVPAGGPTSWRMTAAYAAPEQLDGAPADPAMDVWAWGRTLRDGLDLVDGWDWLTDLVGQALAEDPGARPDVEAIIAVCGRQLGFGSADGPLLGADRPVAWYPIETLPDLLESWPRRPGVAMIRQSMGWLAWLPECHRLYTLGTVPALLRIEELSTRALREAELPRPVALGFRCLWVKALVELVEMTGEAVDLQRLLGAAREWERVGEFEHEPDAAVLAQAWLLLDNPERALPYVRRSYAANRENSSARAAMRLYYLISGEPGMAATVAAQPVRDPAPGMSTRWLLLRLGDLLAADEHAELAHLLDVLGPTPLDMIALIDCVLAGRRGPVTADAQWRGLREHFRTISSSASLTKLALLTEAAFQRGEYEYAASRAELARRRALARLPVHHRDRAVLEAVALHRDPADRGLTARLRNRAELWVADGRPNDPLLRLDLVAAHRWAGRLPPVALELLAHSGSPAAALLASTRHCGDCRAAGQLADLAVCGHCHRTLCARCVTVACRCGGDLACP
ncbi:protein kinase domain-containing protein [Crossiella sp. CA198]|uniref:protein kinase domain-containing protein n=1 Tax=Crossiella sp. CA198 TaxID=3455607 RepID=UPI003F8D658C